MRNPPNHRFQVEVTIGDVESNDPAMVESLQIPGDRFKGEQVSWDRVRGEGVNDDHLVTVTLRHRQSAIAFDEHDCSGGIGGEGEEVRVNCQLDHRWVDLVEGEGLVGRQIAGERTGPEADHSEVGG